MMVNMSLTLLILLPSLAFCSESHEVAASVREDKSLAPLPQGVNGGHHGDHHGGQQEGHSEHGKDLGLGHYTPVHEHHEKHEYSVFHVEFERVEIPFIIALWIFVSSLAKIGFHMTPKLHHIFPESCLLIVVGIIIGFLLFLTSEHPPSTLTPNVFFIFMLPPIILDAGYFMPNRLFFDHLGTILLMAVVGTVFNVLTIGVSLWGVGKTGLYGEHDTPGLLETFLFSSLISAVDPVAVLAVFEEIQVDEVLYIVVFGESLLNDAVTVVLYQMFDAYVEIEEENITVLDIGKGLASFFVVAGGGTIIGIIWGYVTGFVTRFTNHAPILEPMFVFTMAYLSYLCAEIFHMSGILAITFCGITMKNYVERNVSGKSQTTIKYAMKMLSSSSETIIFMFLGVATIHDEHDWNWWFVVLTIFFCTLFRCLGVLVLVALANRYRIQKLGAVDQFVMMYGGLRGAVAFALVLLINPGTVPHAHMFVTTTIAMVYWTVFVQGITIKPLVKFLNVKTSAEKEPSMNERITGRFMDHIMAGMEGILGEYGNLRLRDMYKHIDNRYIKPCLLRENHVKDPKIIETYQTITNNEVEEYMKNNPASVIDLQKKNDLKESKSVSHLFTTLPTAHVENLDMKEINFAQSRKDLTEAKIHHLLSEEMAKPQKHYRKLSYSRHNLDAEEESKINYKVHTTVRRMMSEKRQRKKNLLKVGDGELTIKITEEDEGRVAGSSKQLLDDRVHEMMAATIREVDHPPPPPYEETPEETKGGGGGNSLVVPGVGEGVGPGTSPRQGHKKSEIRALLDCTNAVADNHKPEWMMFSLHSLHPGQEHKQPHNAYDNPAFEHEIPAAASVLPWKREEVLGEVPDQGLRQKEFPSWINNRDYVNYSSPSNTLLGRASTTHRDSPPSIIGYFNKRDSLSFLGDEANWDGRGAGSRRNSRDKDFLSVLTNPAHIRRVSAPPAPRQRSLSSIKPFGDEDEEDDGPEIHLTPIIERKNNRPFAKRDTVLNFENEILKPHYH